MRLMLDPQRYASKPTDLKTVNEALISNPVDITITQLAEAVENGQSFCPGYFGKKAQDGTIRRSNECWTSQQVFGLDFDNQDPSKPVFTVDEFMGICNKYGIMPAIVYKTFSYTDDLPKFRAIWQLPSPVTDKRLHGLIIRSLFRIFDMRADAKCLDPARLFFGGKGTVYLGPNNFVDPYGLVVSVTAAIEAKDKSNFSKNISQFCRETRLAMLNGMPHVYVEKYGNRDQEMGIAEFYEKVSFYRMTQSHYIYLIEGENLVKNCNDTQTLAAVRQTESYEKVPLYRIVFRWTVSEADYAPVSTDKWGRQSLTSGDLVDNDADVVLIDQRPENVAKVCQLAKDFEAGKYLGHGLRWQLMTWYCSIKRGAKYFVDIMFKHYDYERASKFRYYAKYAKAHGYLPCRCTDDCPYYEGCDKKHLPLQDKLGAKRRQMQHNSNYLAKPLAQAEAEYRAAFRRALAAKDNKIYIIKAPTGIGKTEQYLGIDSALIAVPTHELREEVIKRFVAKGFPEPATVGEFPAISSAIDKQIADFYRSGCYRDATKLIHWIMDNGKEVNPAVKEYADKFDKYYHTKDTAIITHERLLYQKNIRQKTVIIDEDPFFSLLAAGCVYPKDLQTVERELGYEIFKPQEIRPHTLFSPREVWADYVNIVRHILPSLSDAVETNVGQLLQADVAVKTNDGRINYVVRRNLPDRKVIILSATANELIYRQMYGDRVDFTDIGNVAIEGKIIQDTTYSYSRDCFEKHPDLLRHIVDGFRLPYITFKCYEKSIPDFAADLHFGATMGRDYLRGQDIMVIGTPHGNNISYFLYAAAIGLKPDITAELRYQQITRNGIDFWFMTFDDPAMREIQLYMIENEIYQAIGRARALRENAYIFLFTNYPIPEATQTTLVQF